MININLINIFSWVLFGLITGTIVHIIDPAEVSGGVSGTVFTGIIGALIGGFIAYNLVGIGVTGFNIPSFVISIVGALLFTAFERWLFRQETGNYYNQYGFKGGRSRRRRL